MNEAKTMGALAYLRDEPIEANPYDYATQTYAWHEWRDGWLLASIGGVIA